MKPPYLPPRTHATPEDAAYAVRAIGKYVFAKYPVQAAVTVTGFAIFAFWLGFLIFFKPAP